MRKRTKSILSACLVRLFIIGVGGYTYVSDYYRAGETSGSPEYGKKSIGKLRYYFEAL